MSEDRVFLCGVGKGAPAALLTAVRHPDLFRAVALIDPDFDEAVLDGILRAVDHQQPALVVYSVADAVWSDSGRRCAAWLRKHGVNVSEDSHGQDLPSNAERSVRFFRELLRTSSWYRIRAFPPDRGQPLTFQFKLRSASPPRSYRWEFGDGATSSEPRPRHTYAQPGVYRVAVEVVDAEGKPHRRAVTLKVPEGAIGPADAEHDRVDSDRGQR
ncbi:MAG: PKD domain-containing protein [Planctomycetota bacterium]|nr:MAG: PKD domain-containing protein [Planctomycetota bacterium]